MSDEVAELYRKAFRGSNKTYFVRSHVQRLVGEADSDGASL